MGATAAIGTVAVGAGLSAYSKFMAGNKAEDMFDRNAGFAEWQAEDARARGRTNEGRQRQATAGVIGQQRTSFASQRVDVNKGSALDVQADAAYLGELDALTIRNNAVKEAYGYLVQAEDYRVRGDYARQEGQFDAFNTLLGGGSNLLLAKYGGGPYTLFNPGSVGTGTGRDARGLVTYPQHRGVNSGYPGTGAY